MREIGTLPKNVDAKALSDHLLSLGMATKLVEQPDGWAVWVYNEDHLKAAREELEAFRLAPDDPRYHGASQKAEAVRRREQQAERAYRKNFVSVSDRWAVPGPRRLPLTFALIVASVGVSLATEFGSHEGRLFDLLTLTKAARVGGVGVEEPGLEAIRRGEVWRLVTPILLHFSILHLVFNMWWLRDLGGMVEARRGTARLAAIVLASAVVSNLAQFYVAGPRTFGGMSGINYALFGYVWMKTQYEPEQGMVLHPSTVLFMLGWFVVCMTGAVGPVANTVHAAGLVIGIIFGLARF